MSEAGGVLEYVVRLRGAPKAAAETRALSKEMQGLAASNKEVGASGAAAAAGTSKMALAMKVAKVGLVGAAAAGFEAVKMGVNFDASMTRVQTQAGASASEVAKYRGEVLELAKVKQQGPDELAQGLYHLRSVGLKGAEAMHALAVSSDAAAVGNANIEDTASALGAAWLVQIKGAGSLDHTMGVLNATVGAGNMRFGELVQALGTGVLPASKEAGLSIQDTMGALAVFTDEGYQASSAAAQFSTALHFLYNPTAKAEKALAKIGLSGRTLAEDMRKPHGLLTAMTDLRSHLDQLPGGHGGIDAAQAMGEILPGGRGRILLVLLNQLERYRMKLDQIEGTSKNFASSVKTQQATAAAQLATSWSTVQVDLIELYDVIKGAAIPGLVLATGALALLVEGLTWFITAGGDVVAFWRGLPAPIHLVAMALLIMGGQLVAIRLAFIAWGIVTGIVEGIATAVMVLRGAIILLQMGSGPLMIGLMLLVAVAILLVMHWGEVHDALVSAFHAIGGAAAWAWHGITAGADATLGFVRSHWPLILAILTGPFGLAVLFVVRHFDTIVAVVSSLPGRLAGAGSGMWSWLSDEFRSVMNWIIGKWNGFSIGFGAVKVHGHTIVPGVHVGTPDIPLLAEGGILRSRGSVVVGDEGPEVLDLPAGARVTPLGGRGGGWPEGDIVLKVDGATLARVNRRQLQEAQARGG